MSIPEIRIKKISEQWIESTFSDVFEILKNNSLSRAELSDKGTVYNIHYGDVLINYDECLDVTKQANIPFVKDQKQGIKLHQSSSLKNGDIVFADAAEDNTVGKCTEVFSSDNYAIVAGLHTIPCRPKSNFAPGYLGFYLNSDAFHNQLLGMIQGTKVSSISKKSIKNTKVKYPSCIEEQESISKYMQVINMLLNKVQGKIDSLKQIKSACLQSMFPQEGESVPKVRFKGFNEKWIKYTLSDIFIERHEISTITDDLPQLSFTISEGIIYPQDRKSNKRDFLIKDKQNKKYLVTYKGDIIYNPANVVFGAIHRNSLCNGVVSPIYKIFSTAYDSKFMECIVRNPKFISSLSMKTEGTVTKLKTLNPESFLEMEVMITPSLAEQQKIAAYFENLDKQISLQTQRLEKLKQIKSACLDKMFI